MHSKPGRPINYMGQHGKQNLGHSDLEGLSPEELQRRYKEARRMGNTEDAKRIAQQQKFNKERHSRRNKDCEK